MDFQKILKNPKPYAIAALELTKRKIRVYFNKGKTVHCEICNWHGTQFFKGKCPKCRSLPRTRLIPFSLHYFELIKTDLSILHIAPNINEYNYVRSTFEGLTRYDRLNIKKVFSHINLVQDLTQTTISDNTYDLVLIWHVFEHINQDHKAIAEIHRILKPNGNLLVSVPIYPANNPTTYEDFSIPYEAYEKVHGHNDHCRSCGLDYYKRFESVGFKSSTLSVKDIDNQEVVKFGLSINHVVWSFKK